MHDGQYAARDTMVRAEQGDELISSSMHLGFSSPVHMMTLCARTSVNAPMLLRISRHGGET